MDVRERTLAVLRGEKPDKLPWLGYYGLTPSTGEAERELRDRGLGLIFRLRVWREEMPNVTVEERTTGEIRERVYATPVGKLTEKWRTMAKPNLTWRTEYLVKKPEDYEVAHFMIRDTVYVPDYEPFIEAEQNLGGDGLAYVRIEPSPFQKLMKDLMGARNLATGFYRDRKDVERLIHAVATKQEELYRLVADSPTEVVQIPDNINSVFTSPAFFEQFCLPYYRQRAPVLRAKGKIVMCHMDGRLRALKDLISEAGLDCVEAFTPPPMGDLSLDEAWAAWGDDLPIWVNFPASVCLLGAERLRKYARELVRKGVAHGHMLLGITEDLPPPLIENTRIITDIVNAFG